MPRPAIRPGESLVQELAIAEEKAGLEIAQLPPASPIGDQPKHPTV